MCESQCGSLQSVLKDALEHMLQIRLVFPRALAWPPSGAFSSWYCATAGCGSARKYFVIMSANNNKSRVNDSLLFLELKMLWNVAALRPISVNLSVWSSLVCCHCQVCVCVCVQGGADGRGVTAMVIYRCRDTADMMCFFVCVAVGAETASCQSHTVLQRQTVSPLLNTWINY